MPQQARPLVVAISGGSASGKSTLACAIADGLPQLRPVVLEQDWYFRDFAEYDPAERERVKTANHPHAVLWPAFHAALETLGNGGTIPEPAPGTAAYHRRKARVLGPCGLLVVAGLFALWDGRCRELADLRLFTEVDDDERVLRRVTRDIAERGGTLEGVVEWYRRDVRPHYAAYTAAYRSYADLVVPTEHGVAGAAAVICHAVAGMAAEHSIEAIEEAEA